MIKDESQEAIINCTEGMVVVDAGPGTGKTQTVVKRCLNLIRRDDVGKDDIVMLTFTRNAAEEMRGRLMKGISGLYFSEGADKIDDFTFKRMMRTAEGMKVQTFDSYCLGIVKSSPGQISKFFRFEKETLTHSASIVENESLNKTYFRRFLDRFLAEHASEYGDLAALAYEDPVSLYKLLERLMARGIIPLRSNGETSGIGRWFGGNDGKDLLGDTEGLRKMMEGLPIDTNDERILKDVLSLEGYILKTKDPEMLDRAAFDSREPLIRMIHDVYYEFIRTSVADDRLTFGLAASFAFIILYEDKETRERIQCRYLIVDEFQDTNSNQLMIALMALKQPNLCVVGDWKQGIYGFRFVSIENITRFEERARSLRDHLNEDTVRICYDIGDVKSLPLKTSYRSSQLIIDNAFHALSAKGSSKDVVSDTSNVTLINAEDSTPEDMTSFETVQCGSRLDEPEEVVRRIENYVHSGRYTIYEKDPATRKISTRPARYSDIAILCRTAKVCKNIFLECEKHGIPVFLQGDMEVMSTREGKLLLAWLRYVNDDRDTWGIGPILADMDYPLNEIQWMIAYDKETGTDHIPENVKRLRDELRKKRRRITDLIATVFKFYGLDNDNTQTIMSVISKAHRSSLMTISDVIKMIESDMDDNTTYKIDGMPDENAVIIQTMHKSKGLEYPIVIIPGVDTYAFPNTRSDTESFMFNDVIGVRSKKEVVEFNGEKMVKTSWKTYLAIKAQYKDYSEEKRLLFVAISRASQYVTMIAGDKPSCFFTHFAMRNEQKTSIPLDIALSDHVEESRTLVEKPTLPEIKPRRKNIGVHSIMHVDGGGTELDESDEAIGPKGKNYGITVHKYAELLVRGISVDQRILEEYPEIVKAGRIIEDLRREHELDAEVDCSLPINRLNVTLRGVIDLIALGKDTVEIHDWKNDVSKDNENEYRLQLSVYAHVAELIYKRKAKCFIQWLVLDETEEFDPLPMDIIEERTEKTMESYRK